MDTNKVGGLISFKLCVCGSNKLNFAISKSSVIVHDPFFREIIEKISNYKNPKMVVNIKIDNEVSACESSKPRNDSKYDKK